MSASVDAGASVRVGVGRSAPSYDGLSAPYGPGCVYPEFAGAAPPISGGDAPSAEGALNPVFGAVRAALAGAGLDRERFGTAEWNPLSSLVARGARVVLKPNFIRHWNPCPEGSIDSVITHGSVLRAVADYAWLAVGAEGSVAVAEAAQHDCDFDEIRRIVGLDELVAHYGARGLELEVIDLRREAVRYQDGVIVERTPLPGDPAGYRMIDLGAHSSFASSGLDPHRFRGADYDSGPTTEHHLGGRHAYLLSETVLSCDLVVNLPKLKTHKKTGVTLALKNLVGINGDKNLLPHHCVGGSAEGGDEFPGGGAVDRWRSRATEVARSWLARGKLTALVRAVRRVETAARGDDFVRSGNWHGNQTTWRMCHDLNRCLYYSDAKGESFDAAAPLRKVLTVLDGVVAGEGEGPLAPRDRPLGVVLASTDPIAIDLAAVRLMGFDPDRIPKLREAMADEGLRVTAVRRPSQVRVGEVTGATAAELCERDLSALRCERVFRPHAGWRGHIEQEGIPCAE